MHKNKITKKSSIDTHLIKISKNVLTVFVGLIASGYEFSLDKELSLKIKEVKWDSGAVQYFGLARSTYCDVNPYWPRGSMLVSASLRLDGSNGFRYYDFNDFIQWINKLSNIAPEEKDKSTEIWLSKLPTYFGLIQENKAFDYIWEEYYHKTNRSTSNYIDIIYQAQKRVISKLKIDITEIPSIGIIPNILGMPYNSDFEKINDTIFLISAQPDVMSIAHEYLHNIFEKELKNNALKISHFADLLNPIYDQMFQYKYAWANDISSWLRVFEENFIRAATIWINELGYEESYNQAKVQSNAGFVYVPTLLEQFKINWSCMMNFSTFIDNCLRACKDK